MTPPRIARLSAADARRVPWRNGRGVTEELLLWPPGASFERGDFDWRLSRAAVDEPGPFSPFAGFDRVLVVTAGAGLLLDHGASAPPARVEPLQPHRFSGDWPTTAALPGGAVADVNVLARRGVVTAEVRVLRPGPRGAPEPLAAARGDSEGHSVLLVLAGRITVRVTGHDAEFVLAERESLHVRTSAPAARGDLLPSGAGGVALLVRLEAPAAQ